MPVETSEDATPNRFVTLSDSQSRPFGLLRLSHVGPQGQRSEYDHDRYRHYERQPEVVADGALVEELPDWRSRCRSTGLR